MKKITNQEKLDRFNHNKLWFEDIYNQLDLILKQYNPCNIQKIDGKIKCKGYGADNRLCCGSCAYWNIEKGCTTKNLSCKLYLCNCNIYELFSELKNIIFNKYKYPYSNLYQPDPHLGEIPKKYNLDKLPFLNLKKELTLTFKNKINNLRVEYTNFLELKNYINKIKSK